MLKSTIAALAVVLLTMGAAWAQGGGGGNGGEKHDPFSDLKAESQAKAAQTANTQYFANTLFFFDFYTKRGYGIPMITEFRQKGGKLTIKSEDAPDEDKLPRGTRATYSTDERRIRLTGNQFTTQALGRQTVFHLKPLSYAFAPGMHEFWHAYKHQVLDEDPNHKNSKMFQKVKAWLTGKGGPQIEFPDGTKKTWDAANEHWYTDMPDDDEFTDEFIGSLISAIMAEARKADGKIRNYNDGFPDAPTPQQTATAFDNSVSTLSLSTLVFLPAYEDGGDAHQVHGPIPKWIVDWVKDDLLGLANYPNQTKSASTATGSSGASGGSF